MTEKLILKAAKKVFIDKGFDGARMQEIADLAGINKALLHYYFRSKEKMFDAVFEDVFMQFLPEVTEVMNSEITLFDKIKTFVDVYITALLKNPHIPIFVLHELSR
ncbi:MAG: TetR/AcrR family transcriptional regulator, partial [Bacteroidetes bacterium]|nr:TetR/AcrR family transcriptional regulator [Bacteroidota bacterium]